MIPSLPSSFFFFFNDTATTEIYTLSLHDALPISARRTCAVRACSPVTRTTPCPMSGWPAGTSSSRKNSTDRKSTRLNSSHLVISYAVFCLKKKKNKIKKHAQLYRQESTDCTSSSH